MINRQFDNNKITIFGGSGSWGNELISQLLKTKVKEIISYARNEFNQVKLQRKFKDKRLKIILGDVRDYNQVVSACQKADIIYFLAAIKHVDLAEKFPYECVKTNVSGARNVVRASIVNEVNKVVYISTDKATLPINIYGLTKAIAEKFILNAAKLSKKTKFMTVRAGNVLGSRGSVIGFWINQIKKYNKISITSKEMTRYFLTLPEAIKLLFVATKSNLNGGLFVLNMPSCSILDLAEVMKEEFGNSQTKIEEIGIRPGEKIHELLISEHEALNSFIYNKDYNLIMDKVTSKVTKKYKRVKFKEYGSNSQPLMTKIEIKQMLIKGGFI